MKSCYPLTDDLIRYCSACRNVIPDFADYIDEHYHRCFVCGYDFTPGPGQVRFVNVGEGARL